MSEEEQQIIVNEKKLHSDILEVSGKKDISEVRLYRGSGCQVCHGSGFLGRFAIFEVLEVDESIRALISKKSSSAEIHQQAVASGMKPLLSDGVTKALSGQTTLMEVIKATYL